MWYNARKNEDEPALVATDHVSVVMLEVTNTPCHTAFIIIVTLISTRCVRVISFSYNSRVTRHILNINKCPQLVRHSRLRHSIQQS